MKRKISSTDKTGDLLSQSQGSFAEITQVVTEIQVTKATYFVGQSIETSEMDMLNREKAAQTLREIAHRLIAGTLGLLLAVSTSFDWQQISSDEFSLAEQRSAEIL